MEWLLEWWIQHHIFIAGAFFFTRGHLSWAGPRMMDNINVLDDQNTMKITDWLMVWRTGFIGSLSSWDLFVLSLCLFLYLPIQPSTHPVIHPSRKSSSISALFWARSCFAELKIWRSQRFDFFFFLFFHTSLKSSIDYTAYSCYHIYALLQASFYSHPLVSRLSETWR